MARACARPGKLPPKERSQLPGKAFALPRQRKYPLYRMIEGHLVPSASHAKNALSRASYAHRRGYMSDSQFATVRRRANKVLARCGLATRRRKKRSDPTDHKLPSAAAQRRILASALRGAI